MTDLFGLEQQPKQSNDRKESAALLEVLQADLLTHFNQTYPESKP